MTNLRCSMAAGAASIVLLVLGPATATAEVRITTSTVLAAAVDGPIVLDGARDITLNCKGFSVTGSGSGTGISLLNCYNVTVKKCRVSGFEVGIALRSTDRSTLTANVTESNDRIGIELTESDGNLVARNQANGNRSGFVLRESNFNALSKNYATRNRNNGFEIIDSTGNGLARNRAAGNGDLGVCVPPEVFWCTGFQVIRSQLNVFKDNDAFDNLDNGFELTESARNTFYFNEARGNGHLSLCPPDEDSCSGFELSDSNLNTFNGNLAARNVEEGFDLDASSDNRFTDNIAINNGTDGFDLGEGSDFNLLTANRAGQNGRNGIELDDCDENELVGNILEGNINEGISLDRSSHNLISENVAKKNDDGIKVEANSDGNFLFQNEAIGNRQEGIQIGGREMRPDNSDSNILTKNQAHDNGDEGIYLRFVDDNILTSNRAKGNRGLDLRQRGGTGNTCLRNTVERAGISDCPPQYR